ncbi:hypothetical protein L7F22_028876 [Adiantum nelumboides]|nr:hypothetical protein [Adiantum nelumboides]
MADNNEEGRINVDNFDFTHEGATEETPMPLNYLIARLQQSMANPALEGEVHQQLQAYGFLPTHQEERAPEKSLGETSKRGLSTVREEENPYQELCNLLLDDTHQSRRRDKQLRWENFLSRFNFHIAGKHNQVADALLKRPKVNTVSIATHNDLSSMIDEYAIDSDFKDVISTIALGKKEEPFTLEDGYLLHGNRLCITHSLREKVMYESHAPPYAVHRGIQTTLKAIETYFYWPSMKIDILDYISKCVVCQKTKFDRGKQPGLLQPLPIPDSPCLSMDFIFGLPKSIHGNMGIWTIVDRFSKQAHFIPVKKTIKAHQLATLFISQVFKYHGLPVSIVLDRDPRMISNFWKGIFENLSTRLNLSSAYHPQMDGQSEIANLTILDLLKSYVTEVDQRSQWEKYLPLVEYAYNNTIHTSIGKAPFEVIEGRPKSPLLLKVHGKIFTIDEYSHDLKESFQNIKEAISISQQKQKATANTCTEEP